MKEELQIAHLVLHPVKFPPLRGEDDNPEEELADPVLARSIDAELDVADETPLDENV